MSLIIPVHTLPTYFSEIHFNIFLSSTLELSKWSYPFSSFQLKCCVYLPLAYLPPSPTVRPNNH
jgi:hypothetical protein